jgi:hypothetical protein
LYQLLSVPTPVVRIRERFAPTALYYEEAIAGMEKELIALMKKNKAQFFDGADQVTLENGILLYGREPKVTIPKNAVDRIEAQGWEDGLKRSVKIDREVISKWPAERLAVIGATRKEKETYSYELKEQKMIETAERR